MAAQTSLALREEILRRFKAGESKGSIAISMGISSRTVCRYTSREMLGLPDEAHRMQALTDEMLRRLEAGESKASIAKSMGLCKDTVYLHTCALSRARREAKIKAREESFKLPALTEEILRRYEKGESKRSIAKALNVSEATVRKHTPRSILTPDQIAEVIRLVQSGSSISDVAQRFERSEQQIKVHTRHVRQSTRAPISPEVLDEATRRIHSGESVSSVSRALGIAKGSTITISNKVHSAFVLMEEQRVAILNARNEGKVISVISCELAVPRRVVVEVVRAFKPLRSFTKEERELAIRAVQSGQSHRQVAEKIGIARGTISAWFGEALKRGEVQKPKKVVSKTDDFEFSWITRINPTLEGWRQLIVRWFKDRRSPFAIVMATMTVFIKKYIVALELPMRPPDLLQRGQLLPDFFLTACPNSDRGRDYHRALNEFIEWVLDSEDFADFGEDGVIRLSHLYLNPFKQDVGVSALGRPFESNKVVMPYYLIADLRKRIVQGPHFKDWVWVRGLGGVETHNGQQRASDWFAVTEEKIDFGDPDCVWRWRQRERAGPLLEMWSPVRWVLQLTHLQTITRMGQARMVDSGEADTFIFENDEFVPNPGPLKQGTARQPRQQGVLRQPSAHDLALGAKVFLFFNSNKTADRKKHGKDKGFECAWPRLENLDEDPYYWLAKLRDWQVKYNPIDRLMPWTELSGDRKLSALSFEQLAEYPDTAFLFRTPESSEPHAPIGQNASKLSWRKLIAAYEKILFDEGIRHQSGAPIELINPENDWPWSSPHATRVSLITHLILDGNVPAELMMKIVGHARFIMTVYYTKLGLTHIQDAIKGGVERLDSIKYETFERDLLNTEAERIREKIIFNAEDWETGLHVNPADRTPLGWLHLHNGICLAGGNAEIESLPGCHNGGPEVVGTRENKKARHGPVEGGVRNCNRCRWKAAGKVHVPAMVATLNNLSYHLHRESTLAIAAERERNKFLQEKAQAEESKRPFVRTKELIDVERRYETAMQKMEQLALDIVAINSKIESALALPDNVDGPMALAVQGDMTTLHAVLEEVDSELLVLAGVCADVEFYPDLDPGTAVFEFAQLLDSAFEREGHPLILARLSQSEKLTCANAIMRELERHANPENPILARRYVVEIMDRGESLEAILGIKLKDILKLAKRGNKKTIPIRLVKDDEDGDDNER